MPTPTNGLGNKVEASKESLRSLLEILPHATTVPSVLIAKACCSPAASATTPVTLDGANLYMLYPKLYPQPTTVPSVLMAYPVEYPAVIEMTPDSPAGTSHCPIEFEPQATTVPSALSANE